MGGLLFSEIEMEEEQTGGKGRGEVGERTRKIRGRENCDQEKKGLKINFKKYIRQKVVE